MLLKKGYGMANQEHGVKNTPDTKIWICSITKSFTAMAIMILEERGLLRVNDSIQKYLPDYPEFDERITIHHLLTHTSGIMNYNKLPDFFERIQKFYYTQDEFISLFKNEPLDFEPGEKWSYSNSGYYLLGVIIERVSGIPYEDFVNDNILKPLGMTDSGFYRETEIVPNRASAYELRGDIFINGAYDEATKFFPSGGLWTTIDDLYKWDRTLYTEKLISKESLEKIFTPYMNNYGYGWEIDEKFSRKRTGHNGFHSGFFSQIYRYVNDDVCIIFLGNLLQNVPAICDDLAAIVFGVDYKLPKKQTRVEIDPKVYDSYAGNYEGGMIVSKRDDKLYVQFSEADPKFEIYPIGGGKFNHRIIEEGYEFIVKDGNVSVVVYGNEYRKIG